jgi:hypothetical protein
VLATVATQAGNGALADGYRMAFALSGVLLLAAAAVAFVCVPRDTGAAA